MKPMHSVRVAVPNWKVEERLKHLLRLLTEYPCGISQVAFFSSNTHTPVPLDRFEGDVAIMKDRMELVRSYGFEAGINHLPTIGHHPEDLPHSLGDSYQQMVNIHGSAAPGTYCMRNERFLKEFVAPSYAMMAKAKPDFIWIDDDIRYGHMPIGNGCFCDGCIAAFNETYGYSFDRPSLQAALREWNLPLRRQWLDHNSAAIIRLFEVIADTVYSIDPSITLGFMTGERYFEGYAFADFAKALSQNGTHPIMWRPGGGAYEDLNFDSIVHKMEESGRQNAYLPEYVTVIQHELENFPYQLLKKTPKSTACEAAMSMTVGCTGTAFNMLPGESWESLDNIIPHLKGIAKWLPFYKVLSEQTAGKSPAGIHTGWRIHAQSVQDGDGFIHGGFSLAGYCRELFSFGLPECYHKDKACVTTLRYHSIHQYTKEELEQTLRGGCYLDVHALRELNEAGYGALTGFEVGEGIPVDAREYYTEHPINEGFVGGLRNCRQAFHGGDSFALKPTCEGAESISSLVDYHDRPITPCTWGLYENELGGRICVGGYYPHDWISDYQKTIQLRRIFLYLSKGTLPSFVESYVRIRNITLTDEAGNLCVTLFNITNDDMEDLTVAIHTEQDTVTLYGMDGVPHTLTAIRKETIYGQSYHFFKVDSLRAYEGTVLTV